MQAQVLQTENLSNMVKGGMIVDYLVQPVEETKINAVVTKAMAQREIARL